MQLPSEFVEMMAAQHGAAVTDALVRGLGDEAVVSVRLNPAKVTATLPYEPVPWCRHAYYLPHRPPFTFDPLLHAGVYYVQEASSMYLDAVLAQYMPQGDIAALDLCAAPGGKSTLLASRLTPASLLVCNEPIKSRAHILHENMSKWGRPGTVVTNNYPADFGHLPGAFDLIVADVPCSGEGMFRKDPEAIKEWSLASVDACWRRQRDIVRDIWPTLAEGGIFIYSTCTFNTMEDDDNARWIAAELGAELLTERHFFPGIDRGEGFYIAALRKKGDICHMPDGRLPDKLRRTMNALPIEPLPQQTVDVDYAQAVAYLRREALPVAAPRGMVTVTFRGFPLGAAKSVGNRLNNLYPKEWRIRTTHTPAPFCLLDV